MSARLFFFFLTPQVLAALAYSRNPAGVWFINPQQWVTRHMFQRASIWDIPLVKPRFACAFDISLSAHGYDIAAELRAQLGHFMSGGKCDRGFVALRRAALRPKPSIEFGFPTDLKMPGLDPLHGPLSVSVVFRVGWDVDPDLLDVSLVSVVSRFPGAAEVVIVFAESPRGRKRLREVIRVNDRRAPFSVGAVEEQEWKGGPAAAARGGSDAWSALRTDMHIAGEFVMQLEVGDVLLADVTYDNIFHFGKPVLPYTRLSEDGGGSPFFLFFCSRFAVFVSCCLVFLVFLPGLVACLIVYGLVVSLLCLPLSLIWLSACLSCLDLSVCFGRLSICYGCLFVGFGSFVCTRYTFLSVCHDGFICLL